MNKVGYNCGSKGNFFKVHIQEENANMVEDEVKRTVAMILKCELVWSWNSI